MKLSNREIFHLALSSRIFYTLLSFLSHTFLPNFDKSSVYFLEKWDAFYFHNIMEKGYTAEHHIAFFPLLPLLTRVFAIFLPNKLAAYLFNLVIFILNSLILYKIQLNFVGCEIAKFGLYFYIFNPVSIIMTAFYTESLFMVLFLLCLFGVLNKKAYMPVLMISLSCLCRSNGILFLYFIFQKNMFKNVVYLVIVCFPISVYQLYCISKIFRMQVFNYHIFKTQTIDLISKINLNLYVPYSYIQRKYWNQGFMKFYTANNIPNMLIGLPFVSFTFCILYFGINLECKNKKVFQKLCVILGFQTVLSIFFLHLNMFFRFISYNPAIYIVMGYIYKEKSNGLIKLYLRFYLAFGVAYAILFGAFYPPA